MSKKIIHFVVFLLSLVASICSASSPMKTDVKIDVNSFAKHPFYIGVISGYGSTTWGQLVPPQDKINAAVSLSTPIRASEGGAIWGVFAGYELIPTFAIEASYTRYPIADVFFSPDSIFAIEHNNQTYFSTRTEEVALAGKFMLMIPKTKVRAFSSVGAAGVHREDMLTDHWRVSPAFGVGFNYNISEHVMAEIGINYTGGYGESELDPVQDYIPFLYSGFARLAYRF